jgi:hypothetical protein
VVRVLNLIEIVSVGVLVVGIKFQSVSIFVMIGNIVAHAILIIIKILFVAIVVIKFGSKVAKINLK